MKIGKQFTNGKAQERFPENTAERHRVEQDLDQKQHGIPSRRKGQKSVTDERRHHGEWDEPSAELMTEQLPGEYRVPQGID